MIPAAIMMALALSCNKEPDRGEPYLEFGKEAVDVLELDYKGTVYSGSTKLKLADAYATTGQCPRWSIYSNLEEWEIKPQLEEDLDWICFWPKSGSECGRFFISVDENVFAETRYSKIDVISGGKVFKTFTILQTGSAPYLSLDMGGVTRFNVSAEKSELNINLKTNTLWEARTLGGESWISFTDNGTQSLKVNVEANTEDESRSADIEIFRSGDVEDPMTISFTVVQLGGKDAFSKAREVTVDELLSSYEPGSVINENIFISGVVTSEYSTYNVEEHFISYATMTGGFKASLSSNPMWIQDASGRGLCCEFMTAQDNIYHAGTALKLHLVGQTLARDSRTKVLRVAGLNAAYVHDVEEGHDVTPVEVTDLSRIAEYEDRLVTLKDVQFALPYGTYFNVDVRKVNVDYMSTYPETVDASARQYPHIVFDRNGNYVRLFSASTFTDRHCRLMPSGSGDITGIVSRRKSANFENEFYIRLRTDADNKVSEDRSTSHTSTIVRFGPFTDHVDMPEVRAHEGNGTIKTSVFTNATAATSSVSMYFNAYATIWNTTFDDVTIDTKSITPAATNQFWALNSQAWYNATGTTLTDAPGEAWIITTNTLKAGSGSLYLIFSNASYNSGPHDFIIEWAEDQYAPLAEWKAIGEYDTCSWNANWQSGEFFFRLPDEIKGKENVVIRHRVTSPQANNKPSAVIDSGATNRMCYWEIVEIN